MGTRKNNNDYKNKTNHIQKHRALNNLVKYLKHIEKDDKIMKDNIVIKIDIFLYLIIILVNESIIYVISSYV